MNFDDKAVPLDHRGRAGLQFLGSLQVFISGELLAQVRAEFDDQPDTDELRQAFESAGPDTDWSETVCASRLPSSAICTMRARRALTDANSPAT